MNVLSNVEYLFTSETSLMIRVRKYVRYRAHLTLLPRGIMNDLSFPVPVTFISRSQIQDAMNTEEEDFQSLSKVIGVGHYPFDV